MIVLMCWVCSVMLFATSMVALWQRRSTWVLFLGLSIVWFLSAVGILSTT